MNHNDRLREPAQTGGGARALTSGYGRGVQGGLVVLGAILLVILVNGCASFAGSGDYDPWQYNPNTGAPHFGPDEG